MFVPLIFSKNLFTEKVLLSSITFINFYLMSALVYVINDYIDIENDKKHPTKKYRPLASGKVSKTEAKILILVLLIINIFFSIFWLSINNYATLIVLLLFLVNNITYTLKGKQFYLVDIIQIAFGYVLRVIGGSLSISVMPSMFLVLVTFTLTFSIGMAKRIREIQINGIKSRVSLVQYNKINSRKLLFLSLLALNIFYAIYTLLTYDQKRTIMFSIPFVIMLSHLFAKTILHSKELEDDPSIVFLKSRRNLVLLVITIIILIILIYV
ncbi:MAG: UbiA family prenyltransferase [Candidatus Dojkabacteria bacterium]|nr:UbiA family prenyltransferase [Candidatus Dojkabacteria bacterium]